MPALRDSRTEECDVSRMKRANRVHAVIARMTHAERSYAWSSAVKDGDLRRADDIALVAVPSDWPEHERAIWRDRQAIARSRRRALPDSCRSLCTSA